MHEDMHTQQYMVMSFSHKNADIALRERLSFAQEEIVPFLQELNTIDEIKESILVSTCNRIELYLSVLDKKLAQKHTFELLHKHKGIALEVLNDLSNIRLNQYAIYHIFSVASSLDSLVVGETQITGQLKSAYKISYENKLCSKDMTRLMHFAFKCAAAVRKHTDISSHSVSVASTAVNMAAQKLSLESKSLEHVKALVVGSGEMGRLACKHLQNYNASITLISRTQANAQALALELQGCKHAKPIVVEDFHNLAALINTHEVLFSATSSPSYVITKEMSAPCDFTRHWFDLALPRDIQTPADSENLGIHVYCVDDLQEIINQNKLHREESAKIAQKIVEGFSADFFTWLQSLSIEPLIKHIRSLAKQSSLKELDRAIKKGFLPKEQRECVEKILHGAFNTFLHTPTMRLKLAGENPQGDPIVEAMKNIFDISDEVAMLNSYKCERDTTF